MNTDKTIRRFVLAGFFAGAVLGQSPGPRFEMADVHVSPASAQPNMRGGFYRGGRYEIRSASMVDLIRTAYSVDADDKVSGGPAWLEKDRFDVIAKAPADSTADSLKLMLQGLLAERFSLAVHNDTRPLPGYALRVGKKVQMKAGDGSGESGCKLQPQDTPQAGGGRLMINMNGVSLTLGTGSYIVYSCRNVSMASFGDQLRSMIFAGAYLTTNRVVDETELKGTFSFDFKYSPKLPAMIMAGGDGNTDVVTLFDAVDKQLGLRLEATKIPLPVIAVDSVNEKPTENAPGVTEKLPVAPTEFEVADIKPSDPNFRPGPGNFVPVFQPGGRVNLRNDTMADLIGLAWNLNGNTNGRIIGLPKSLETAHWDIVAKAPTSASLNAPPNGQPVAQNVDYDSMRVMVQALLKDRFGLVLHTEDRPLPGYALLAVKPKMKAADPANRPGCKEGPGADGKDPRTANPAASRLVTCLNMTMADFAAQISQQANGYFVQFPGGVVDETKLEGAYDITLSFSAAGIVMGGGGGRGGDGGSVNGGAGQALDPSGAISLQDALEKQQGLKLQPQKNPAAVLVVDHVAEKPSDN